MRTRAGRELSRSSFVWHTKTNDERGLALVYLTGFLGSTGVRGFTARLRPLIPSPFGKGLMVAIAAVGGASVAVMGMSALARGFAAGPSGEQCSALAQIGATLLIAYAIETSWVLKSSFIRSSGRQNWVGFVVGLGLSALIGTALALALSGHRGDMNLFEEGCFAWAAFSVGILGILVAYMPWLIYSWSHQARTEYPDED